MYSGISVFADFKKKALAEKEMSGLTTRRGPPHPKLGTPYTCSKKVVNQKLLVLRI